MAHEQIDELRRKAQQAANKFGGVVDGMNLDDIPLYVVSPKDAVASNKLDEAFWGLLGNGAHLNKDFLAQLK